MMSNQRSPLWPYLLVLTGLFFLSLAVPRGWHDDASPARPEARRLLDKQQSRPKITPPEVAVVRPSIDLHPSPSPTPAKAPADSSWQSADTISEADVAGRDHTSSVIAGGFYPDVPLAESVAAKIADLRIFDVLKNTWTPAQQPIGSGSDELAMADALEKAIQSVGSGNENDSAADEADTNPSAKSGAAAPQAGDEPSTYWPAPRSLLAQLNRLMADPDCQNWAANVRNLCLELCRTSPEETQHAGTLLRQLQGLVDAADSLAGTLRDSRTAEQLRRVRYGLQRRLAVWDAIFANRRQAAVFANVAAGQQQRQRLSQAISAAQDWLRSIPYADAWQKYLMFDQLLILADPDSQLTKDETKKVAREVLTRLSPRLVSESQRRVLDDPSLQELTEQLRPFAVEAVDVRTVLTSLEQYEASGLSSDARRVMTAVRQLNWSGVTEDRELSQRLDQHYRNANLRISLAADLLDRLVPEQPAKKVPVDDRILGAPVKGFSQTTAQLQVKFVPDSSRLHLWLEAEGVVDSQTQAIAGKATFSNQGESNYHVRKEVIIDAQGITAAKATGEAKSDSKLTGVHTEFDGVPVIGSLARNRATAQLEKRHEEAEREVNQKVATRAEQELNAAVDRRLQEAEQLARQELLAPLTKLELQVDPVSLETAAQRMTVRLRLAGTNQLGGHTARPQAPSDSLASIQLHESVLNNMLDQLQLAGRSFTLPDLVNHLTERVAWPTTPKSGDLPQDVTITFASSDPVRVRCQNGDLRLTLAIAELRQGKRQWHDFLVSANYQPLADHLHLRLARQGSIELGGDTYQGQPEVVLRGIFSKLLARDRTVDLVPAKFAEHSRLTDLCITQCVLEDGWMGVAMGPDRSLVHSSIATRPETDARR